MIVMNAKLLYLLIIFCFMLGIWNCKDLPPTAGVGPVKAGTANVTGSVLELTTSAAIQNATVYLAVAGKTDSMLTGADGTFHFQVNLSSGQAQSAVLSVKKFGYIFNEQSLIVTGDTSITVLMKIDLSTSALITGTVRDSATLYPLRNTTVLLSLPGFVDSMTTTTDGVFQLTADLVDRDSLPVFITAYKAGYNTRKISITVHKGQTTNLGSVLMQVDVQSTIAQIVGRVTDHQSGVPITNASLQLSSTLKTDSTLTATDGSYTFTIDLSGLSSISGILKVTKSGYKAATFSFTVSAGQILSGDIALDRDTTTGIRDSTATGSAHSIAFITMTNDQVSIYGVGGVESTILTWEVRDSLGFPIDFDHRDTVMFQISGAPVAGGAYVSPSSALTNASGRVSTTVNSGTVAGVLQFIATLRRNSDGVIIQSTPVIITVNAGLPDQKHFTIGANQFNFAGYDWVNHTDGILVQVGDTFSNPVKVGTAVYFHTTGGVIDASGFSDITSHAFVNLYSGNPRPNDPVFGKGYAWISATTIGNNSVTISDSELILFSGISQIPFDSVSVATFAVPAGKSSAPISYVVEDENHNPLAPGTQISVALQYTAPPNTTVNLVVTGDVNVTLGDYLFRGPGTTHFSFRVADQTVGGVSSQIPVTVVITVTSPNGSPPPLQISGTIG
jgi:hypothetical protein